MPTGPEETESKVRRGLPFPQGWFVVTAVVILAIIGGTAAYVASVDEAPGIESSADGEGTLAAEADPAEEEEALTTTPFTDPGAFVGQEVNTNGKVVEVVDPNSFRITSGSDDSLLVVYSGFPPVKENMAVDVFSTMLEFNQVEVEKQLNAQLSASVFDLSDDEYALVAHTVTIVDENVGGTQVADASDSAATDSAITAASTATGEPVSSAPATTTNPGGYGPVAVNPGGSSGGSTSNGGSTSGGSGNNDGSGSNNNEGSGRNDGGSNNNSSGGSENENEIAYTGDSTSAQHSDETEFEASLTDPSGEPVEGARVTFELKDTETAETFAATTDHKGIAKVTEEVDAAPGRYRLIVKHGNKRTGKVVDKTKFVIEKDDTELELNIDQAKGKDDEAGSGKATTLTAVLTDADSARGIAGRTVNFYADGQFLGSGTTDSYGFASLDVGNQDKKADFEAVFGGDDYYLTASDTA